MKKAFAVLLLLAVALTFIKPAPGYDDFVAQVETRRVHDSGACPLAKDVMLAADPEAVWLCAHFGLDAWADYHAHPQIANAVYGLLGQTAELHEARALYGAKVVPVIYRYYTEGSTAAQLSNATGEVVADLWNQLKTDPLNLAMPATPEELSPEQLAVYALLAMQEDGEVFLVQFELLPDGTVKRKPVESVAQNLYSTLAGGVRNLEQKAITGQTLTPYDYGGAALDLVVVYAGWKLIAKPVVAKAAVGKGAVKTGKFAQFTAATTKATKALTVGTKLTAVGVLAATGYVALTDPLLLVTGAASAGGWVAEQLGWPNWAGQLVGYALIALLIWACLWPARMLWRWSWKLSWPVRAVLGRVIATA